MPNNTACIAIGGPTATGKSLLAVRLAEALDGVVINADSLQVYRALPVLTAQPLAALQGSIEHHLYGYLPVDVSLTAASWAEAAKVVITKAQLAGKTAIVVGGSGLYLEALLSGLATLPAIPPYYRQQAAAERLALGAEEFYHQLTDADPLATRLHASDTQRVLRAREVWLATGRSLYSWHDEQALQAAVQSWQRIAVLPARADLYAACNARFDTMLAAGVIEEVEQFRQRVVTSPVTRALGYSEIDQFLSGNLDRSAMQLQAQAATRHYAKRQNTWFNNRFKHLETIVVSRTCVPENVHEIVGYLLKINQLADK